MREAKAFKRWVTAEVLPSIRKSGEYINEKLKKEIDNLKNLSSIQNEEIEKLKTKTLMMSKNTIDRSYLVKNQKIYIASTRLYTQENIFKIGGTTNIEKRFVTYNTERPLEDRFDYVFEELCYDFKLIENIVSKFLERFKVPNKREVYNINLNDLIIFTKEVIKDQDKYVYYMNKSFDKYINNRFNVSNVVCDKLNPYDPEVETNYLDLDEISFNMYKDFGNGTIRDTDGWYSQPICVKKYSNVIEVPLESLLRKRF